jgi:hypothetical protein
MVATDISKIHDYEGRNFVVVARFYCALILHMALMDEVKEGL